MFSLILWQISVMMHYGSPVSTKEARIALVCSLSADVYWFLVRVISFRMRERCECGTREWPRTESGPFFKSQSNFDINELKTK